MVNTMNETFFAVTNTETKNNINDKKFPNS